jgi:hypothetical protein
VRPDVVGVGVSELAGTADEWLIVGQHDVTTILQLTESLQFHPTFVLI